MRDNTVIIIGAGWAGLSAAYTLVKQGLPVTLIEAAPRAGGRARGIPFSKDLHSVSDNYFACTRLTRASCPQTSAPLSKQLSETLYLDNGQHLLLGAYQHILSILNELGISEEAAFNRYPLWLKIHAESRLEIKFNALFPPLHLIVGLMTAKGLKSSERKAFIRFCREINHLQFKLPEDLSVETLLLNGRQPPSLITQLWEPIALAALSTPIAQASAQVFLNVLKHSFTEKNKNSNFLFPKTDLSQLFVNPIIDFLKKKGATLLFNQGVQELLIENDGCVGVKTKHQIHRASNTLLATSPTRAAPLLKIHPKLNEVQRTVSQFQNQPITTVYLRFDKPVNLTHPMAGFINQTAHWVFDRKTAGQADWLSIVITGQGEHLDWTVDQLTQTLLKEIKFFYPQLSKLIGSKVVREKSAAFLCEVNIDVRRPPQKTPLKGLYLAGDYTQTGYPATLEGAVKSGITAAELLFLTEQSHFTSA